MNSRSEIRIGTLHLPRKEESQNTTLAASNTFTFIMYVLVLYDLKNFLSSDTNVSCLSLIRIDSMKQWMNLAEGLEDSWKVLGGSMISLEDGLRKDTHASGKESKKLPIPISVESNSCFAFHLFRPLS
jgi:hypothetical protein